MRPDLSSAPRSSSSAFAFSQLAAGGGVSHGRPSRAVVPHSAQASTVDARSASTISGFIAGTSVRSCASVQSRRQSPGAVRPARPRRWSARSRVRRSVSKRLMPELGENRLTRMSPESMTVVTPSIVSEVSAMDVASTTLRRPSASGSSTRSCSSFGIAP